MRHTIWVISILGLGFWAVACAAEGMPGEAYGTTEAGLQSLAPEPPVSGEAVLSDPAVEPGEVAGLAQPSLRAQVSQWLSEERYGEAREALERRLAETREQVKTVLMLATVEIADEEYDRAYELTDETLAGANLAAVDDLRLLEKRAFASLLNDDPETAAVDYQALLDRLDATGSLALCSATSGSCRSVQQVGAQALMGLGTAEFDRRNLDAAERIARSVLAGQHEGGIDPARAQFLLALVSAKRGDDGAALGRYEQILDRYPNEPSTLNNVGGIYYRRGDLATARRYHMAAYEHAGRARRLAAIAWANVGELDMLDGKLADAEDKVLESLQISKRFAYGHLVLALIYELSDRQAEASAELRLGLELDRQGVTRWNTTWLNADWEAFFAGLVAEQGGRQREARRLFSAVSESGDRALAQAAARHLQ